MNLTPEQHRTITALLEGGARYSEVAGITGVGRNRLARLYPGYGVTSAAHKAKVARLHAEWAEFLALGCTYVEVAHLYGVTPRTVATHVPGKGSGKHPKRVTAEQKQIVEDALLQGLNYAKAGALAGISPTNAAKHFPGFGSNYRKHIPIPEDALPVIDALLSDGWAYSDIADKYNYSVAHLRGQFPGRGLSKAQSGTRRKMFRELDVVIPTAGNRPRNDTWRR